METWKQFWYVQWDNFYFLLLFAYLGHGFPLVRFALLYHRYATVSSLLPASVPLGVPRRFPGGAPVTARVDGGR